MRVVRTLLLALVTAACCLAPVWTGVRADAPTARTESTRTSSEHEAALDELEQRTFAFFLDSGNPKNGLIPDHWPRDRGDYFSSVAAIGFALTGYGIAAERHWLTREQAIERTHATLRFLHGAKQDKSARATGYHGFYYHFLDMESGTRYGAKRWVELSTIDTTLLLGGVLFCREYFDRDSAGEAEIRKLADEIYRRVDWRWAAPRPPGVALAWSPEAGFHAMNWQGYNEAMLLYLLALGSPTHPLEPEAWDEWTSGYERTWGTYQGQEHLGFGPLFGHQYSHVWVDFRGIQDAYMRGKGIDYFENSRRAALAQRQYAIDNPMGWKDYGADVWGLSASNGPAAKTDKVLVREGDFAQRSYFGYSARGAAITGSVDDGTIAPTAAVASIVFTPEYALDAIVGIKRRYGDAVYTRYGFLDAFNPSYTFADRRLRTGHIVPNVGWVDTMYLGIDQGPILAMIENHRSELVWRTMRKSPYLRTGLVRAGFKGGWLDRPASD